MFISTVGESVNDVCAMSHDLLKYVERFVVDTQIWSDDLPIVLSMKLETSPQNVNKLNLLPKLLWTEGKKEEYRTQLNTNLQNITLERNISNINDLTSVIRMSTTTRISTPNYTARNKWFDDRCYWSRRKVFKALKDYRKSKLQNDKEVYLLAQKKYTDICKLSKEKYLKKLCERINITNNGKEWWKLVKEIRNQEFEISDMLHPNDFRDYFMKLLTPEQISQDIQYAPNMICNIELDRDISVMEVRRMLKNVKLNKAPGEDRVPYEFFVHSTDEFLNELVKIFNKMYEEGNIDEAFTKTIIFPIYKKGSVNEPGNYRGISFMNTAAKIFMGILNSRLLSWLDEKGILVEYQAGFRKKYSTADNIYNLASIVNIKLAEKKKVYAYFVDFKAAFDKISRKALIYKLHEIGVSYKFVKIIEQIYTNTKSAVWTGEELSEYFTTTSGVKQGCLLSPLLFALYLNDLHDSLGGGLEIEGINIRLLLYADDIVIMAENVKVFNDMIRELEKYCDKWDLEVNKNKSKIMIFRNGGRLSAQENWKFKGENINIVSEYNYLGVILTPKMSFSKHLQNRTRMAKCAVNSTWENFLNRNDISLQMKWNLFLAACRSIQAYAAQVWGFGCFEEIDKLQRFFLKRILKLPACTPNYALEIETGIEDGHMYTLKLHLQYIVRTMFSYEENRLPHILSKIILRKQLFWAKDVKELANGLNMHWVNINTTKSQWLQLNSWLVQNLREKNVANKLDRALSSSTRIYRHLDHSAGSRYFRESYRLSEIALIFKARCDIFYLNGNRFNANESGRICTLCNTREDETLYHFIGKCPIFNNNRMSCFGSTVISENDVIAILNGWRDRDWENLIRYLKCSLNYRKFLIAEFN